LILKTRVSHDGSVLIFFALRCLHVLGVLHRS
jgi:hypothetical protein